MMNTLGIIGGTGPSATAQLYLTLQRHYTGAKYRPNILINSIAVPHTLEYDILLNGASIAPYKDMLVSAAINLEKSGATFLILPCNTLSYFIDDIRHAVNIPVLNIINLTVRALAHSQITKVGLLATSHTLNQGLYAKAARSYDIELMLPNVEHQQALDKLIHDQVSYSPALAVAHTPELLVEITQDLARHGAQNIILGCTDLPRPANLPSIDPLLLLAQESLKLLSTPLKA
ncbi:amino acid racemase [Pseudoalteromonas sp. MMG013]|uniref:aspartate/glutamate racemase family protein n=1 Tax=Pseudoalteromonas sp. MMG013 TaxID=2822687 RepID=UPI001B37D4D4|nr:amino acid racemase [Pseudoalteromonas sp. MMG013]MBQ4861574.1 amino acid racemase [Pseudoalteromonas sp. MMG013]